VTPPSAAGLPVQDTLRGILLMCGAFIAFSLLDTAAKYLGQIYPMVQVVWARYVGHAGLALLLVWMHRRQRPWRSAHPWLQFTRGCLLLFGTSLNFLALRYLQLAETASIYFSTPLLVAALAVPILGERIGPRRLVAIIVGFIGVLIVIRPGMGMMHWAVIFSCLVAISGAFYQILTRMLASSDSPHTAQLYAALIGLSATTPFMPIEWVPPEGIAIPLMLVIGLIGGVGHWMLTVAHAYAPAPILAPFTYTQIVWMPVLGYAVFGNIPSPYVLLGGAIVVASGLYLLHRERAVKAKTPPPV
jgi:drug/metabolite transporter (DMT)-like permease